MRSFQQWQTMIARTQKTAFALSALKAQLERERHGLAQSEFLALWQQLSSLEPSTDPSTQTGLVNLDYRPEGMGGRGRLYLEVGGRTMRQLIDNEHLDALQVYLFEDGTQFAGLQIDNANSLPERLPAVLSGLEPLLLEPLDCSEAGLYGASLGQILEWAVGRYF
jgi:hypothetical protein